MGTESATKTRERQQAVLCVLLVFLRHRLTMRWKVAAQAVESACPLFAVAVFVRTDALEVVRASRLA